ncbi:rod shape-determining protein MreC [Candidatus Pantoea edessiphila]|uniref:Cell shape-determining protein MreC n=1 Tax=Candidatus Pantoea edessiphila TaxID=2044610 RepID=A0A2P5T1S0_9GAMM|nr:rod shape-determining protein MreC [Candidatus Pantoea edessiphila]PPI88490.1 rod shape-determining protein MreC [Candidatus Pantoea edessiphila]
MKLKFSKKKSFGLRLFFAIFLSITFIFIDYRLGLFAKIRSYFDMSLGLCYSFIQKPSQVIKNTLEIFSSNKKIRIENKKLRLELFLKNTDICLLKQYKYKKENENLLKLLNYKMNYNKRAILSKVIFSTSIPFASQVVIDKGKLDGVYKKQPVITDKGIVGQVVSINENTSHILLACDSSNELSVKVLRNNIFAVISGEGCNKGFKLKYLINNHSSYNNLRLGDIIVTSGLDNKFPEGYPVGVVSSIEINKSKYKVYAHIHSNIYFKNLNYLLLL